MGKIIHIEDQGDVQAQCVCGNRGWFVYIQEKAQRYVLITKIKCQKCKKTLAVYSNEQKD